MSLLWERYVRRSSLNQMSKKVEQIGSKTSSALLWKRVTFLVATPAIALCMINAYSAKRSEKQLRPPFIKYEHLRRRNKRFPWGNGERSLLHNSNANSLTDGYEV